MPVQKIDEGEEQRVQVLEAGHDLKEKEEKKDEKDEDEAKEDVKLNEAEEEEDKEDGEGNEEKDDGEEDEADKEEKVQDSPDSKSGDESDEYIEIELEDIRRHVQCPICLGIIKKTRTMMECLHRFCGECIEKSLRLGNNECPVCRTHCPSRRSLRDDPNFDKFIATLFQNIDSFEEELNEEEKTSNKETQESIAQVSERRKRKRVTSRGMEEELRNKKN